MLRLSLNLIIWLVIFINYLEIIGCPAMANRIFLVCFNSVPESNDLLNEDLLIGEAANKFPLLWAALFDLEDLIIVSGEDENEFSYFLQTEITTALKRLNTRLPLIKKYFPQETWKFFDNWQQLISSIQYPIIQVNIDEFAGFYFHEEFLAVLKLIFKFDWESIHHMFIDCSLNEDLVGGLAGYIEETFHWNNREELCLKLSSTHKFELDSLYSQKIIGKINIPNEELLVCSKEYLLAHGNLTEDEIKNQSIFLETISYKSVFMILKNNKNYSDNYLSSYEIKTRNEGGASLQNELIYSSQETFDLIMLPECNLSNDFIEILILNKMADRIKIENGAYELVMKTKKNDKFYQKFYLHKKAEIVVPSVQLSKPHKKQSLNIVKKILDKANKTILKMFQKIHKK